MAGQVTLAGDLGRERDMNRYRVTSVGRMPNGYEFKRPRLRTFAPRLYWGVMPDGTVAFSDSTTYAVKIAGAGPGIVRILTRPIPPEPVTDGVIRGEKRRRIAELEEEAEPGDG